MEYKVGQFVIGKVKSVKPYALFLDFDGKTNGLLHISEISDSFIRDIEKFGRVGDELKVKVINIDSSNGFLRVSLKQVPKEESFSTHSEGKTMPVATEEEFATLREKIPTWIKETLDKIGEKND
mgnify:CR=1 FL=1